MQYRNARIKKMAAELRKQGTKVKIWWIPGHAEILRNEDAHQLAHESLSLFLE